MVAKWSSAFSRSMYLASNRDLATNGFEDEIDILAVYVEAFGDTTLGRGGMGGQAITEALTMALYAPFTAKLGIYRGGGLDYIIDRPNYEIVQAIREHKIPMYTERHKVGGRAIGDRVT